MADSSQGGDGEKRAKENFHVVTGMVDDAFREEKEGGQVQRRMKTPCTICRASFS